MTLPVATRTQLTVAVVPHTHWDREWYQPFERFRMRLVRLIDRLLALLEADPDYGHFMLDGQSIVLEDYLAIRPHNEARLARLIAGGRIAVGPWYVLPDSFLVSGESLVRNLRLGMETARRFGKSMEIGYLPDSFGHPAQMPQILAGFGFETACLWRGVGEDLPGIEWRWAAPDGTSVHLQWLAGGYGNFANLPADPAEATRRLEDQIARMRPLSRARTLLLMNGSDHLLPQPFLSGHLRAFREAHPDWKIRQVSLAEVLAQVRDEVENLPVVQGELRSPAHSNVLPGVLSARTYLKVANVCAQQLLERWVEPFSVLAAVKGRAYPAEFLDHAWKLLLQNHPHDSICGCSVDAVHDEMMTRFARVGQVGEALRQEAFAVLQGEDPEDPELVRQAGIALYNPHPWPYHGPIEAEITLDCAAEAEPQFTLVDAAGTEIPYEMLDLERRVRVLNRSPLLPLNIPSVHLRLRVIASVPALGYRTITVTPGGASRTLASTASGDTIQNAHFRVRALPGGVEIHDLALGEKTVHFLEARGDRGDEYNFCPVEGEIPWRSLGLDWEAVEVVEGPAGSRLRMSGNFGLPAGLSLDRRRREGTSVLPVQLEVSLYPGVRRVQFHLALDHQTRDHRLRAAFQVAGTIARTTADTAFGWVTRESAVPVRDWEEAPVGTFPMVSQVLITRPAGMAGVSAVGLHEFEAVDDVLHLTLIRAVGWLSRDDLSTRRGDAGPMLPTPGAQCPGPADFRYAWASQDAVESEGMLARRHSEFLVAPLGFPTADAEPHEASYLTLDQPAWQFSALTQDTTGRWVLRCFNGSPEPTAGTVRFGFPVRSAELARLDGTPAGPLPHDGEMLHHTLRPYEIATFLISH